MQGVMIDTRGLSCPLPVLKVRKAMRGAEPGAAVTILATDPLAEQDLRAFCAVSGCAFLSVERRDEGVLCIVIQKRRGPAPIAP